jgi:hypothetical protein
VAAIHDRWPQFEGLCSLETADRVALHEGAKQRSDCRDHHVATIAVRSAARRLGMLPIARSIETNNIWPGVIGSFVGPQMARAHWRPVEPFSRHAHGRHGAHIMSLPSSDCDGTGRVAHLGAFVCFEGSLDMRVS